MESRLPDELFRRHPDSDYAEVPANDDAQPAAESIPAPRRHLSVATWPVRSAAMVIFVCLVLGFLIARQLITAPEKSAPLSTHSSSPVASSSEGDDGGTLYQGPTRIIVPRQATSSCPDSHPEHLLDGQDRTRWLCERSGVGQQLHFAFGTVQRIVGLRIAAESEDAEEGESAVPQITTVRWRFSDGSWFDQGLTGRLGSSQEVAFPEVRAEAVTLEVLATAPTSDGTEDAVTLGSVEFLSPN